MRKNIKIRIMNIYRKESIRSIEKIIRQIRTINKINKKQIRVNEKQ